MRGLQVVAPPQGREVEPIKGMDKAARKQQLSPL